jgi:nucleotide-binding universal stress UspA family protein
MYKRILVPLDGSALSEQALPYATYLAGLFNASIELLFAVKVTSREIPEAVRFEIRQDGERYLKGIAGSLPAGLKPSCKVQPGRPAEAIVEEAEVVPETLVAMATHGYSGLQRWVLGGVAQKVTQCVSTPVLLVPARAEPAASDAIRIERFLVPLDGSATGEYILPHIVPLCKALDMELILLRVYVPNLPGSNIRMHAVARIVREAAEAYLQETVRRLQGEGMEKVSARVLRGVPAEQINDFARDTPHSLTAMCTHRRSVLGGRCVLGSVTSAVIHSSETPVLILRGPPGGD